MADTNPPLVTTTGGIKASTVKPRPPAGEPWRNVAQEDRDERVAARNSNKKDK